MLEGILLGLALIGIFLAFLTNYSKTGLALTLVSVAGYLYLVNLSSWTSLLFLILGIIAIIFEMFIPDFGLLGIIGGLLLLTGIYSIKGNWLLAITELAVALIISAIIIFALIKSGMISDKASQFVLTTSSKEKTKRQERIDEQPLVLGQEGVVTTPLRPTGRARFSFADGSEREVEVVSENEALNVGTAISIIAINGNKIMIRRITHE